MERFRVGHAARSNWSDAVAACVEQLGPLPAGANLGFVYVGEAFADVLDHIAKDLSTRTGVPFWVGTAGHGVCASGVEYMAEPAVAILVGHVAEERFALIDGLRGAEGRLADDVMAWAAHEEGTFGVIHADPRHHDLPATVARLSARIGGFLVGGLGSAAATSVQIAGDATAGGLSGLLLGSAQPVLTGLTQGCRPIGPFRAITGHEGYIVHRLDDRRALDALAEDAAGEGLDDLADKLHVAFPVQGSDRGDYLVRNLIGVEPTSGGLAVAAPVNAGQRIAFVRRDAASARADLERMLDDLIGRLDGRTPRGALYYSCVARGRHLFGEESVELELIGERLGDVPLAGFFANGEIFHDRLYAYTGVLTLLL
ncbi:FIST signal transduction protein [Marinivivus vitaminiproducens]|uniref:FIST signal transduction protein n=1 Tax=Marinivivus vitaminiproducens TaxID=3035935 RepID=UPI00279D5239|nr:FIST C-terminal domain-containing protein [Geminicoccaceae bacterium SCSIO 64248]